jgi:hypothetical protein
MAQLLITIGPWLGVLVAVYLATMTRSYYAACPRWLIVTIRTSAASYGATVALQQLFIGLHAETANLISAILGLISVCVMLVASLYAMRIGSSTKPG